MDTQNIKTNRGKNFPNRARYGDNQKKIIAALEKNPGATRKRLLKKLDWNKDYHRRVLRKCLHISCGRNKGKGLVDQKIVTVVPAKECSDKRDHLWLTRDWQNLKTTNLKLGDAWFKTAKWVFENGGNKFTDSLDDFRAKFGFVIFPVVKNGRCVDHHVGVWPVEKLKATSLEQLRAAYKYFE